MLNRVTLPIWAGGTVAVVGSTGSGKSTLIKLLPRLYEPSYSAIRLGGADVRDLDRRALRRRIVVVSQDVFLFAGTLGDNIGLGDPTLSRETILEAARQVGAPSRVIARRPEGLDAPVLERGANFSAGERQLISFARPVPRPRDPDPGRGDGERGSQTERLIERGTEELMRGATHRS